MKTDNGRGATGAKIQLRKNILAEVSEAKVFDAFSGLGNMYEGAWIEAQGYVGCDERDWSPNEPHRRYVADNRLLMRAIDLSPFNVFDFDAYGSPWDQMLILLARRQWRPGEEGAVVLTDGSSMKTRFGGVSASMGQLLGMSDISKLPRSDGTADNIQKMLLSKWCSKAKVKPRRIWRSEGRGSGRGGSRMVYTACVFDGISQ